MSVGARWREARDAAGLSAAKAAAIVGCHENTIYLLESDKKNDGVTVRVCKQVADAYGVTLGEIFAEPNADRVPSELRPLQELLTPLDVDARISFIRNVVANARFMAQLISVRDEGHTTEMDGRPYHPSPTQQDNPSVPVAWNNVKPGNQPNGATSGEGSAAARRTPSTRKGEKG